MGRVMHFRQRENVNKKIDVGVKKFLEAGTPSVRREIAGQVVQRQLWKHFCIMQRSLILFYRQKEAMK